MTWVEDTIVTLMTTANPVKLKWLVDNNQSLIQFALSHPKASKVMMWGAILKPFINMGDVSAERVMELLQRSRPDLAQIVNVPWIQQQVNELRQRYG